MRKYFETVVLTEKIIISKVLLFCKTVTGHAPWSPPSSEVIVIYEEKLHRRKNFVVQ